VARLIGGPTDAHGLAGAGEYNDDADNRRTNEVPTDLPPARTIVYGVLLTYNDSAMGLRS
jgi:hypothetical protein